MALMKELKEVKNQIKNSLTRAPDDRKKKNHKKYFVFERPSLESKWEGWIQNSGLKIVEAI